MYQIFTTNENSTTRFCNIRARLSRPIGVLDVGCRADTPPPPPSPPPSPSPVERITRPVLPRARDRHRPGPIAAEHLRLAPPKMAFCELFTYARTHAPREIRPHPTPATTYHPTTTRQPFLAKKKNHPGRQRRRAFILHITIVNDHVLIERTRASPTPPFVLLRSPAVALPVTGKRNDRAVISLPPPLKSMVAPGRWVYDVLSNVNEYTLQGRERWELDYRVVYLGFFKYSESDVWTIETATSGYTRIPGYL